MLGVLKKHLLPKRAREDKEPQNPKKNVLNKSEIIVPVDVARLAPSQRQIHPLFEEKLQILAYDDGNINSRTSTQTFYSKKIPSFPPMKSTPKPAFNSSIVHPLTATATTNFHPPPNICVEEGRIEFIKSPSEGSNLAVVQPGRSFSDKKRKREFVSQSITTPEIKSIVGVTRAQQTETDFKDFGVDEKCDFAKDILEAKIKELQKLLETEQKALQKEKLAVARLQKEISKRDATQRDVDRERRLRADTESRLRETINESERYRETLAALQREFSKMEDTVKSILQYKTKCEILNQEKVFLTAIHESRAIQYQNTITKLENENESLKQRLGLLENIDSEEVSTELLVRLRSLETENANLVQDADLQRKQYERCLDDIANQVVRALLSQKSLREEIGNLQRRIKELENQNHALTNILLNKIGKQSAYALPSAEPSTNEKGNDLNYGVEVCPQGSAETCSSTNFNFKSGKRKRLQRLHLSDFGDYNILKSFDSYESLIVVRMQRPKSLSLHLHNNSMAVSAGNCTTSKQHPSKKVIHNKKQVEDEENESPESGNRDEGYSTMSSDVQGVGETSDLSKRELEDLKEASDETEVNIDRTKEMTSNAVVEDISDPEIFFMPVNVSLTINSRHSYPPSKKFLPFQLPYERSISDSHLYLKLTSAIPTALSPSIFSLKKSKTTSEKSDIDISDLESSTRSWYNGNWWDTEFFQHWLKLDDTRIRSQQQSMLQLQYDREEIEEWSMTLSCEDLLKPTEYEPQTSLNPHFNNYSSKYLKQKDDTKAEDEENWFYDENNTKKPSWQITSSNDSLCSDSSNSEDCCNGLNSCRCNDCCKLNSKSFPAVSDDAEETSAVDTDFTRDFYRLVKFESTKSLTSNSSNSNNNLKLFQSEFAQEREVALQCVLSFIAEQQKYCYSREEKDVESETFSLPYSLKKNTNNKENDSEYHNFCDNNIKLLEERDDAICSANDLYKTDMHPSVSGLYENNFDDRSHNELSKRRPLTNNKTSVTCETNYLSKPTPEIANECQKQVKHRQRGRTTRLPIRNSKNKNLLPIRIKSDKTETVATNSRSVKPIKSKISHPSFVQKKKEGNNNTKRFSDISDSCKSTMNITSKLKKINCSSVPNRTRETLIPVLSSKKRSDSSCCRQIKENKTSRSKNDSKTRITKIPVVSTKKTGTNNLKKPENLTLNSSIEQNEDTALQESLNNMQIKSNPVVSSFKVVDDSSFHEKATTKDVINELNKIIRKREELTPNKSEGDLKPLDVACCCPTGWVHVERNIDFTDPKVRANLLDVMLASSGSSLETESSSDSGGDEPVTYNHLQRLQKFRKHKKESAQNTCPKSVSTFGQELHSPETDICTPITPTTPMTPSDDSDEKTGGPVSLSDSCVESYPESVASLDEH